MSIIEVNNLTKEFRLGQIESVFDTLKRPIIRLAGGKPPKRPTRRALEDVDFCIDKGEVVGLIGVNGAGKSTLLKIISRITAPTSGSVTVNGSIAPLIDVGAGLHRELSGRENIFLNAAILGVPRSVIKSKVEEVVEFAEIGEFADTPIKRFSSGMKIRLGFSIATNIDADILIVDEVLAVGDLAFQRKCFSRMDHLITKSSRTVLMVSHNIRQIERLCTRVILLDNGRVVVDGPPKEVCELYYSRSNQKIATEIRHGNRPRGRWRGTGEVTPRDITLLDAQGCPTSTPSMQEALTIQVHLSASQEIPRAEILLGFHTTDFFYIASMSTAEQDTALTIPKGNSTVSCTLDDLPLMPGTYALRLGILDDLSREHFYGETLMTFSVMLPDSAHRSRLPELGVVHIPASWSCSLSPPNYSSTAVLNDRIRA